MKKIVMAVCVALVATVAFGYQVAVGTYVANASRQVTVPVSLDSSVGLAYASATITYDPQVLVVTKVAPGSLISLTYGFNPEFDFIVTDTNGTLTVSLYGFSSNAVAQAGSIAEVTFAVREGTAGLYSDLAVTDVQLGDYTGVRDVTVGNPLTTVNGMVRVMSDSADVVRLENAQIICADTVLRSLRLSSGDAIQASDAQTAIAVAGAVTADGTIPVKAPVNGWASGRYDLLTTTTEGLAFALEGIDGTVLSESAGGVFTYYTTLAIDGEVPVVCDVETLDAGAKNLIRGAAELVFEGKSDSASLAKKALFDAAKKIEVVGPAGSIAVIADMGVAPAFPSALDATGALKLTFAMPALKITAFDPKTGAVRIKVTPGEGNTIVSELATGYVHVYGTNKLGDPMKYISQVGFDLTPYLKPDTKGEAILNITLGTHTFLKVKVESGVKIEGQEE